MEYIDSVTGATARGASASQRNVWRRVSGVDPALLQPRQAIKHASEPPTYTNPKEMSDFVRAHVAKHCGTPAVADVMPDTGYDVSERGQFGLMVAASAMAKLEVYQG